MKKIDRLFLCKQFSRFLLFVFVFTLFTSFSGSSLIMLRKDPVKSYHKIKSVSERLLLEDRKKHAKQRLKISFHSKYKNLHRFMLSCILRLQQIINRNRIYIHFIIDYFCTEFLLNKIQYLFRPKGEKPHLCLMQ